ncbi:DNA translocase FtsK, partial [Microvirga yunnanensis]|uniref:DNA translocase FtsK n=2 Tax=Microvirga TaxID=186650 RepID=UPI0021C6E528
MGNVDPRPGIGRPRTADPRSGSREAFDSSRALRDRGPNGAPRGDVWEQSFSMSPDVRFTRTPERVLKERRMQTPAQPATDGDERQAREIASMRAADPAPAVQERLRALQSKAASQETGSATARAFTRTPPQAPDQARRVAPVRPRGDAPQRHVPAGPAAAEPAPSPRPVTPPAPPVKSSPAPYELPAIQQSYSFMWQPGTYLLDPTLPTPSASALVPAPIETRQEERAPAVKKATPPVAVAAPVPTPLPPAAPELLPWEEDDVDAQVDDLQMAPGDDLVDDEDAIDESVVGVPTRRAAVVTPPRASHAPSVPVPANDSFRRESRDNYASVSVGVSAPVRASFEFHLPSLDLLAEPKIWDSADVPVEVLQENAATLENVLWDFNVKGEIINVRPGPVVTLYELEPAPGTKSSRVISLADDIARSMSAVSARVAVVQGRN